MMGGLRLVARGRGRATAALLLAIWGVLGTAGMHGQSSTPVGSAAPVAGGKTSQDRAAILAYIRDGWDTLSRSMVECKTLRDEKVKTAPVLYLPADLEEPTAVAALGVQCGVEVRRLPRVMTRLGDVRPAELKRPGLLYLPNKYVVPGGRFNEMYGWDSYFILLGLMADGREPLAKGMVENFDFEIEHYGALLNANRTYYLTRSQPPLLSSMIAEVYVAEKKRDPAAAKVWLAGAYRTAGKDYGLWVSPAHRAGTTGLARYFDIGEGPVAEMEDDSTYYPDAIRWMLAHPEVKTDYLVRGGATVAGTGGAAGPVAGTMEASCDVRASTVCERAHVGEVRLNRDFYKGDRAMRESGFDTSFRFGPFSGSTHHFAPVCLNSLLFAYERNMGRFAEELGRPAEAKLWQRRAAQRRAAMDRYLWDAAGQRYMDYDFVAGRRSTYFYGTAFYPLWAGAASTGQAAAMRGQMPGLEREFGLAMSERRSGMQWDAPYGWAPVVWFAEEGLRASGFGEDARRLAVKFTATVERNFARDGTIREKYNVETGTDEFVPAAGYKANVVGFGWTNGVYLRLLPVVDGAR